MNPIVSYAIFESETSVYRKEKGRSILQFTQFLPMLIRGHHSVWRGFDMRLHHDDSLKADPYYPALLKMNEEQIIQLIDCGPAPELCRAMLWRLIPAFQGQDKVVVCRDVDSIPMFRDRMAVEEWMLSGKAVHSVHDNPSHSGIMGGTTSVRSHRFQKLVGCDSMEALLFKGADLKWQRQGADQDLLNRLLPLYARETLVHQLVPKPVADMGPIESRTTIADDLVKYKLSRRVIEESDKLCFIGGCTEPKPAFDFFDSLDFPEKYVIQRCERG